MRFSANLFALAALPVYNNFIETVKTLLFDLKYLDEWPYLLKHNFI